MGIIEDVRIGVSAITSMGTHKLFLFSNHELSSRNQNGTPKHPSEIKYFTFGDELVLIPMAIHALTILRPDEIGGLVRQWAGPVGEQAYMERISSGGR